MIYQLKVTLAYTKPPIWRRLQVDSSMTFRQLHDVLQIAFEWEDYHLHQFEMPNIPDVKLREGQKNRSSTMDNHNLYFFTHAQSNVKQPAYIGDSEMDESFRLYFFDENEEILSDWLVQEKDRCRYVYDFGDDWQHHIMLEKILPLEHEIQTPLCVKARRMAPEEDSRGEWLDEDWQDAHASPVSDQELMEDINYRLNEYRAKQRLTVQNKEMGTEKEGMNGHELDLWSPLFEQARQFKKLKPWEWMSDVDIFAVVDHEHDETAYCCVLGNGGETFGLAVYLGNEGFSSLIRTLEKGFDENDPFFVPDQRALSLTFENREDLAPEDYDLIKKLGLSFRGANAWPVFRSMSPGYYPWFLDEREASLLANVLEQVLIISQKYKKKRSLLRLPESVVFARVAEPEASGIVWRDSQVSLPVDRDIYYYRYVDDITLRNVLKQCKIRRGVLECDVSYYPQPTQDEEHERPFFPLLYLCVEQNTGMVVDNAVTYQGGATAELQYKFIDLVQRLNYIPSCVCVQSEKAFEVLYPLADELGFELKQSSLPLINEIKSELVPF